MVATTRSRNCLVVRHLPRDYVNPWGVSPVVHTLQTTAATIKTQNACMYGDHLPCSYSVRLRQNRLEGDQA